MSFILLELSRKGTYILFYTTYAFLFVPMCVVFLVMALRLDSEHRRQEREETARKA